MESNARDRRDDSPAHDSAERWIAAARALRMTIPAGRIERIAPVLDSLFDGVDRALDHDLSLVEPCGVFRPAPPSR